MRDRVLGCLVGVAVGDAIGTPWEMFTKQEIIAATFLDGHKVSGFQEPVTIRRKFKDSIGMPLGTTSDDWQLTEVVGKSLVRRGTFDITDMALAHVEAYETSTFGWGGSTRDAIANIKKYFDTRGKEGQTLWELVPEREDRGHGNGVLMKISPLACAHALRSTRPEESVVTSPLYRLTPMSITNHLRAETLHLAGMTHRETVCEDLASVLFGLLTHKIDLSRSNLSPWLVDGHLQVSLANVFMCYDPDQDVQVPSAESVRLHCGTSSKATESVAFCLATFLRNPTDFRAAVLEAVNAGGDTDTNASIVGALVGANVGLSGIPEEWIQKVPSAQKAIALGEQMVAKFGSNLLSKKPMAKKSTSKPTSPPTPTDKVDPTSIPPRLLTPTDKVDPSEQEPAVSGLADDGSVRAHVFQRFPGGPWLALLTLVPAPKFLSKRVQIKLFGAKTEEEAKALAKQEQDQALFFKIKTHPWDVAGTTDEWEVDEDAHKTTCLLFLRSGCAFQHIAEDLIALDHDFTDLHFNGKPVDEKFKKTKKDEWSDRPIRPPFLVLRFQDPARRRAIDILQHIRGLRSLGSDYVAHAVVINGSFDGSWVSSILDVLGGGVE